MSTNKRVSLTARILEYVRLHPGHTYREIARDLAADPDVARVLLYRLRDRLDVRSMRVRSIRRWFHVSYALDSAVNAFTSADAH